MQRIIENQKDMISIFGSGR